MVESNSANSRVPPIERKRPESRSTRKLAIACILVAWLAFDHPVFLGRVLFPVDIAVARAPGATTTVEPRNPLGADAVDLYYPWRTYLGERLREGGFPLWDPHRFAGTPAAANTQMAVWYPPNWLFAFDSPLLVYSVLAVLSRLAFLLLGYWFFRVLSLHPMAAALGAIVLVFCGFQWAWSVHPTFISSSMWLPLALGGLWLAVHEKPRKGVALGAIGLGLSFLGGHAQVAMYVWIASGLWALVIGTGAIVESHRDRLAWVRGARRTGGLVAATFVLGAGLSSLQLLSTAEVSDHIVRGPEPLEDVVAAAYPLRQLAVMFLPDRFGNPVDGNFVGQLNYTETAGYAGVGTLILAAGAFWRRPGRETIGFSLIGVTGLAAALGTPLYSLLYSAVPGMDRTRAIGRFIFLVDAALAGLAALGLNRLLRDRKGSSVSVLVAAGIVGLGLGTAAFVVNTGVRPGERYLAVRFALVAGVLVGVAGLVAALRRTTTPGRVLPVGLVVLVTLDLWVPGFRYLTFQDPRSVYPSLPATRLLGGGTRPRFARSPGPTLPLNAALVYGLYDVHGSDTFILKRTVELLSVAQDQLASAQSLNIIQPFDAAAMESPVIDLLGVRSVLMSSALGSYPSVDPQLGALPPAFMTTCWDVTGREESLGSVAALTPSELRTIAVVEAESATLNPSLEECGMAYARILRYQAERVELEVNPTETSILVLTDAWFPGWEARVDGRPTEVLRTNHALRGILLDAGDRRVVFDYRPGWLRPGLAVTGGSIAIIAILLLRRTRIGRRSGPGR